MRRRVMLAAVALLLGTLLVLLARWQAGGEPAALGAPDEPAPIESVERETPLVALAQEPTHDTPHAPVAPAVEEETTRPPAAPEPERGVARDPTPASTDVLRREIDFTLTLAFTSIEPPNEQPAGLEGLEQSHHLQLVAMDRDATDVPAGSRAVRRTYERITADWRVSPGAATSAFWPYETEMRNAVSPFAGETVRFLWDAGRAEYRARPQGHRAGIDDARLAGLAEDLGLSELAPPPGSFEGTRWTVDADVLGRLMRPGGDLQFPEDVAWSSPWTTEGVEEKFEGRVELELGAPVQRGGRELLPASLELDATARFTADYAQELHVALEAGFVGEGHLTWDVAAGRVHDLELECDATARLTAGTESEAAIRAELEGSAKWRWNTRTDG